jgi:hypothetical protein
LWLSLIVLHRLEIGSLWLLKLLFRNVRRSPSSNLYHNVMLNYCSISCERVPVQQFRIALIQLSTCERHATSSPDRHHCSWPNSGFRRFGMPKICSAAGPWGWLIDRGNVEFCVCSLN